MNDTQFQIDHLIELAVLQRAELKQLVDSMPQLRDHLSEEIERNLEEAEPAIRSELEQLVLARAKDAHAETSVALTAKIDELAKALEITTAAKYSVLMAERAENVNLLAKAEARIEDAASMLTHAVKEIVTDELSRFPRAGEIDQLRKEFAEPRGLNPRGRWAPDETYQRLDLVTINGDSFVSNIDGNRERPSRTAGDWTLSAARGNGGGGGGVTSMTDLVPVPTNGQLLIGNGSAFVNSTLTAGTGISISNGAGSITINATDGNITLDDGTAAAPSLNFTNEPTTGLFRASANVMGFAVNGVSRATMTTTGVTVTGTITPTGSVHAAAGSVGNPSLAFDADQDTGLFRIGANNLGVAAGGAKVLDVATTGLGVTGTLSVSGVATLGAGAILNTPASGTLTNATGLPISTGVSGLGTNVAAFLATPSSANLAAALTDETGTGANVFATSPTLTTPISATLTSPAATNLTLAGGTAGSDSVVVSNTLAASSSIIGAFKVGNGTAGTNVAIGGGNINAGGTLTVSGNTVLSGSTGHTGKIGVQAAASTNNSGIITIQGSAGAVGGYGAGGISDSSTFTAVANSDDFSCWGLYPTIAKGAFTGLTYRGIDLQSPSVSGAGTIATHIGINVRDVNRGTANFAIKTGSGVVSVGDSTAGSAGAGALVVTGGLATGAASFIGGALTAQISAANTANYIGVFNGSVRGIQLGITSGNNISWQFYNGSAFQDFLTGNGGTLAATFAGAVSVGGVITSSVTNGAKTLQSTPVFSVVQDAVQNLAAQNYGFFFVSETTSTGSIAIIASNAGGPYLVWQQGSDYSVTANTASKYNVYYSAGNQLVVQNKKTATASFNIINLCGPT